MKFSALLLYGALLLLIITASCSVKQEVFLESDGAGHISFDIGLADYLTAVVDQASMLLVPEEATAQSDKGFFDLETIRTVFKSRQGVELIHLEAPNRNRLVGKLTFSDINQLIQDTESNTLNRRIIRLNKINDTTQLIVRISRESMEAFFSENPSFNNPLVENFGPSTTEGLSDQDYLEMAEFALGKESRRGIQESSMSLTVHVNGSIIKQIGGKMIDKNTVQYSIPALSLLMLRTPLEYSLHYK